MVSTQPLAHLGGRWGRGLADVTDDLAALDSTGRWAVVVPYTGAAVCARFEHWTDTCPPDHVGSWRGPGVSAWVTSMDEPAYVEGVEAIRSAIAAGSVYQANLCRIMSAPLPDPRQSDVAALAALLARGNPAPYGGFVRLPDHDVHIATASPELFVSVDVVDGRRVVRSSPIKGTARDATGLSAKDAAENVMIVDLVRNDLSRVSRTGSVTVPGLLEVEGHPGLVHLVSTVEGELRDDVGWPEILSAAFPPGSVTGAPKLAALSVIAALETASREFYCGAVGWVDADAGTARLAVAIRTFWRTGGELRFGTGAGITWGSDAHAEWLETELKAEHLIGVTAGSWQGVASKEDGRP